MNTAELIYQEAKALPEADAREVLDFLEFLKAKRARGVPVVEQEPTVTPEAHATLVERMRAIRERQPMTHTTVEEMRREARY
jgi:hypothetical protein